MDEENHADSINEKIGGKNELCIGEFLFKCHELSPIVHQIPRCHTQCFFYFIRHWNLNLLGNFDPLRVFSS